MILTLFFCSAYYFFFFIVLKNFLTISLSNASTKSNAHRYYYNRHNINSNNELIETTLLATDKTGKVWST